VFGRDADKAAAAAATITAQTGAQAMAGSADVLDDAAVATLFDAAVAELGPPDVVIAGAAGNFMAQATDLSTRGFKAVVDIDLIGTYTVFRAGFDRARRPAAFIAITAPQAVRPMPMQAHVCAAKAGVNMLVRVLAMEWGPAGIRVNAISPGPIEGTEGVARMAPEAEDRARWTQASALRRFGTPADIADAAIFLASDQARFITGAILDCDGGMQLGDSSGDHLTPRARR
jgi:NAD(P)-dependent dehydrogenase (short-subunit alcohol dehydrogenase family)